MVAKSNEKTEFRAMANGVCKLLWLKIIVEDLKVKQERTTRLHCDNNSTNIAQNLAQHDQTKHIEVD